MDLTYEAGTLTASREDRTVTGLLVPYGEVARSNLGRFSVDSGVFSLPSDVTVLNANVDHDHEQPVARFQETQDTPAGLVAKFKISDGEEGDTLLAEIESGERKALSAEVKNVVIRGGKAVAGRLFGAAFVKAGAFPSASLYAADAGDLDDEIEVNGVTYRRVTEETTEGTASSDDAAQAADKEAPVAEDQAATAAEETEEEQTLKASLPNSVRNKNQRSSKGEGQTLFAALAETPAAGRGTLLAALDQIIAADALPAQQQQWLGEIYAQRTYQRRYASLIQHANLSALKATGWRFVEGKTPEVADYAGFPAQPNSNEVKTEQVTLDAKRLAGAGAVDRAFLDFPTPEFWAGYFREFTNSYERQVDGHVLAALIAGATSVTRTGTLPTGVSAAAALIVRGARTINDAERDTPSFAIVGSDLYEDLTLTRSDDTLAYLNASLGLEDGTLGQFSVVSSPAPALAGKVLVGAKSAATLFELPGSPVRVDTVNIANGGAERGVFGYHAELINDAKALVMVGTGSGS